MSALGPLLLASCERAAPLPWKWHVEPHPEGCDCPDEHVGEARLVTSRRFVTADIPRAQLCVFSGDRMQVAYVRLLSADGRCEQVVHVPGGEHAPVVASYEARAAWVREIVPRLVAAARAFEDRP